MLGKNSVLPLLPSGPLQTNVRPASPLRPLHLPPPSVVAAQRDDNRFPYVNDYDTMRQVTYHLVLTLQMFWDFSLFLHLLLLGLLVFRGNVRALPFFSLYLVVNLLQALFLHFTQEDFTSKTWAQTSPLSFALAWGSEAVVMCARALAVAELCRLFFAGYRGIWSLAWRVLLGCASLVLLYSAVVSRHKWSWAILGASRALELAIATVIVVLFVFLRHYHVVVQPALGALALGFCFYSCVAVLNNTLLERWLTQYVAVWNLLSVITFMATLLVWAWALRKTIPLPSADPVLLPGSVYQQLSPEVNLRLRLLNERLCQFWNIGESQP
jgi:hypothetical protein